MTKLNNNQEAETNEELDELTQVSMNILIHSGNARDNLVKALTSIETSNFQEADKYIKQARQDIVTAHGMQTSTLQKEASGEQIRYSTLFSHAQDTMMTAQSEILIGEHLIKIFKTIISKK
ncbi:PTS lactose/cellobiose transporter subunit IIA [Carnobacterium sp. CS13]|uniref:PTS lactose/cellobiose transporter subunit IIA n=1 Tax=Carnobacterium sp. CS13 TaxID=2800128 RepID=UPI001911CE76|nr:PTS lactose/cellobiose transporter subunit IIA [Carnobacterium sp. CS13]QQP69522.1 PTS lactose/cellobiose transporter subunit IIA [Carnobacterium sp. CS13]